MTLVVESSRITFEMMDTAYRKPLKRVVVKPDVCGGEPCIVRTRIPVRLLEQARQRGTSEAELLRIYPTLRAEDLANAWGYVRSHREEITGQIEANEAD